jgi:hypothetical protein
VHIGNTQQFLKNRIHARPLPKDVKQHVEKGTLSNSHAKHFGGRLSSGAKAPTPGMQRSFISSSIIWKGDPISSVKSFGKNSSKLCNRERMVIVKAEFKSLKGLINARSELYGACHHVPRFHYRLSMKAPPRADECKKREKVDTES